jgi:nickel transport protein
MSIVARSLPLLLMLSALPATAHDLWLTRDAGGVTLQYGHLQARGNAPSYKPDFVKDALCLNTSGQIKSLPLTKAIPWRNAATDCAVIRVMASNGYWTKTPWVTKNVPKTGINNVVKSWLSELSVKYVERWVAGAAQPMSASVEITPLNNPLVLKAGDNLNLLVTQNRQPVVGARVEYDDVALGTTDQAGRVTIPLLHGGMQLIETDIETPLTDGKADVVMHNATLQFEIAK